MSRDTEAKDAKPARFFDKRTVERNIKKGLITRKDYEKYLKSLDDAGEKGVYGSPVEEPDEADDDLADDEREAEEGAGPSGADGTNSHG
jgi:hypothetical protein